MPRGGSPIAAWGRSWTSKATPTRPCAKWRLSRDDIGAQRRYPAPQRRTPMYRMLVLLALALTGAAASAQTPLKVKMFPGAQALPALSAASQGIFERHGLKVEILFTANSDEQRAGLAKGEFEIAQAAVDNAVAMVELAKED